MGRMKDVATVGRMFIPGRRPGRSGGAGGRDLVRVTERARCPVCGRGKLCRVTVDGAEVWCSRESAGAALTLRNDLGDVFVHRADGGRRWEPPPDAPPPGDVGRAGPVDLDRAYRATLARLALESAERAELERRGLDAEHIARGMYRTLRVDGRAALARALVEELGVDLARGVPGVVWRVDGSRGWWSLAGAAGLVVPVRDFEGRVVALKIRRRGEVEKGQRYTYVSSSKHGGPAALAVVHVPAAALDARGEGRPLVITEGELKADVATALCGRPVVSLPGVGNWRRGVELARAWGARSVAVAFDADARSNPDVARHQANLLRALEAEGFDARLWQWPPAEGKGLDDVLLARRRARDPSPPDPTP